VTRPRTFDTATVWNASKRKDRPGRVLAVVTIKSGLRQTLKWEPGDLLEAQVMSDGALLLRKVG